MSTEPSQRITINSWLEEELYQEFVNNKRSVDESWKEVFESDPVAEEVEEVTPPPIAPPAAAAQSTAAPAAAAAPPPTALALPVPPVALTPADQLVPLYKRRPGPHCGEDMSLSLTVPTATSQRTIPVKVIDENRRLLNHWRDLHGKSKISYTHLIAWAIVKAAKQVPGINHAYAEVDGQSHRVVRPEINIGIAVDVAGKDGHRSLLVPSIKNAGAMGFYEFLTAFDDIVVRSRTGKLVPDDFRGTTISLTNPGTVGTLGSVPRLMPGARAPSSPPAPSISQPSSRASATNSALPLASAR